MAFAHTYVVYRRCPSLSTTMIIIISLFISHLQMIQHRIVLRGVCGVLRFIFHIGISVSFRSSM